MRKRILLVVTTLLLAACSSDTQQGISLQAPRATYAAASTQAPAGPGEMPDDDLGDALNLDFLGVTASFHSPDDWNVDSAAAHVVAYAGNGNLHLGMLLRATADSAATNLDDIAAQAYLWLLEEGSGRLFVDYTYMPRLSDTDQFVPFQWGEYAAEAYSFALGMDPERGVAYTQVNVVLELDDQHYLVFWTTLLDSLPDEYKDTWLGAVLDSLQTVTVNGSALPPEPVLEALDQLGISA